MPKDHAIIVRVAALLLLLLTAGFAAEPRRVEVYAPQSSYQVDILVREGVDYVGLTDLLEPLGRVESRVEGKKLKLTFNGAEAEFEDGKRQFRARGVSGDLPSKFLLVDGRGYIPAAVTARLLTRVSDQPAEFHANPRRLFVGGVQFRYTAELRHSPSRLVLAFPAPVNPSTLIERGRVRLLFRREPLVSNGTDYVSYGDPFLASTTFAETSDGAEFVASTLQQATVSMGDGGRTITILAGSAAAPAAGNPAEQPQASSPAAHAAHARPFVILDAAHGGSETGAIFSPTLQEKAINLALAKRLQKELETRGIPVVLTRIADNLLTWDQRAVSANTSHASLYIALHASTSGHGVRLYTAMIPTLQPGQSSRSFLPWELAQSPFLPQSNIAATALAAECNSASLPVRTSSAPLRPLNSVTVAAVAVEVAPLGSSADELSAAEYQQKVVNALATAIVSLRSKLEAGQ